MSNVAPRWIGDETAVWIVGRAGCGKTTFAETLMKHWGWHKGNSVSYAVHEDGPDDPNGIAAFLENECGSGQPNVIMLHQVTPEHAKLLAEPCDVYYLHSSAESSAPVLYSKFGYDSPEEMIADLRSLGQYEFLRVYLKCPRLIHTADIRNGKIFQSSRTL